MGNNVKIDPKDLSNSFIALAEMMDKRDEALQQEITKFAKPKKTKAFTTALSDYLPPLKRLFKKGKSLSKNDEEAKQGAQLLINATMLYNEASGLELDAEARTKLNACGNLVEKNAKIERINSKSKN